MSGALVTSAFAREVIARSEPVRAIGVPPRSVRVLNVGYIDNVGVYARSHCAVGSCEGNGNNVYMIIVFLNSVGARIARPRLLL